MWEETLVFTLHMPEIALIRFLVWDHDPIGRDFIGQRTIAFSSMMPGKTETVKSQNSWLGLLFSVITEAANAGLMCVHVSATEISS